MHRKRPSKSSTTATATTTTTTASATTSTSNFSGFDLGSPDRPFDNILNFRDVGRSVNEFSGLRVLREGVLFRSARPDDASERDRQRLVDDIGLSTVIDLRSNTEHEIATRRRRNSLPASSPSNDSNSSSANASYREHLLGLPPTTNRHFISLTGRAFERLLLWRLDWYNFIKVLSLLASGYRPEAIKIIASQVMKPRGLIGLAQDTLDCAGAEIREVFDILTRHDSYPVLLHCTQGKDRTGLVVMLLLFLVADASSSLLSERETEGETEIIPLTAVASDYMKSEAELRPELESLMKEITAIGLDEEYAKTPSGFMEALKSYLDVKYGGVRGYLLSIGVVEEKIEKIRRILLA